MLIPVEVARRVAPRSAPLVAPPINYALSYPHVGFTGVVHIRIPTFMALIEDLCASLAADRVHPDRVPQRPLRQHVRHRLCLRQRGRADARRASHAFPVNYWDGMTPDEAAEFFDPSNGLHANRGETVGGAGDRPGPRRHGARPTSSSRRSRRSTSPAPSTRRSSSRRRARSIARPQSGTWGDAREATAEFGERYLGWSTEATVRILDDIERTQAALPDRR